MGWIALALGLALAMRLFALILAWDVQHFGDPYNYIRLAGALDAGQGLALPGPGNGPWMPTALFPPVLPLLLAGVGLVFPLNAVTLALVNSLIDGAAALLLGRLSKQLGRPDLAVPLGLAYLVWPSIALMAPLAYKEGLIIALLLASLVALLEQERRGGWRWAALSGLAAGTLILTQPGIAPLLPLAFVALAPCFSSRGRWFRASLIAAGVTLLLMLPWWVRNAVVFGQFIPFTSSGGLSLWQGAHPGGGMQWQLPPPEWGRGGELGAEQSARAAAWQVIAGDPLGYIQRCLAKFPTSFLLSNWAIDQLVFAAGQPWPGMARSQLLRFGPTLAELIASVLAVIGLVRLPRSIPARLLWACVAQIMVFGIWFEFSERHRLLMVPFILIMAATILTREHRRRPALDRA